MDNGQWSMGNGQWSIVNGQGSMVNGQGSVVQWTMVNGQWSMVKSQGSMVKGQLPNFFNSRMADARSTASSSEERSNPDPDPGPDPNPTVCVLAPPSAQSSRLCWSNILQTMRFCLVINLMSKCSADKKLNASTRSRVRWLRSPSSASCANSRACTLLNTNRSMCCFDSSKSSAVCEWICRSHEWVDMYGYMGHSAGITNDMLGAYVAL